MIDARLIRVLAVSIALMLYTASMAGRKSRSTGPQLHALREIFETTPIGVVAADLEGRLLFANHAFCSMLGCNEEDIRSKSWTELSPSEDAGKDQTLFRQLAAGSTYHYHLDKRCSRRDGSLFAGHWSVWWLRNRESPFVLAMITDHGQAYLARRETEEHFRYLADSVPVMIWTSGVDGLCTYNNKRWLDFTGRSFEEQLGNGWAELVHPDDRQQCLQNYKHALDSRKPFQIEYRLRRHDGEYRWVLGSGVPRFSGGDSFAGYIGSVIDVTELKRATATLRESEERFRSVANTAPVMIWMSGPDKLCSYFNQPWLDFTGRPLEAELGNGWAEGVHPEDLKMCLETYMKAFDLRESFQTAYRLRRHDGEYRWVFDQGVPRFYTDGSFAGYIGSCIDITERKLAEEVLSTFSQRLIDAQEEERRRIARELHDDISQRLGMAALDLDVLKERLSAGAARLKQDVEKTRKTLTDLGADIRVLSHGLHSFSLEHLGLATAARGFCKELSDRQRVQIESHFKGIPEDLPEDISLCLFRVLQEALQNATRHSGSRRFRVSLSAKAGEVELEVRDSGVGFEPQEVLQGRGLGLISMKERLKLVRGKLFIDSRSKHGTTIRARVPLKPKTKSAGA